MLNSLPDTPTRRHTDTFNSLPDTPIRRYGFSPPFSPIREHQGSRFWQSFCNSSSMIVRNIMRGFLDALYPPICLLCGRLSDGTYPTCCSDCLRSFEYIGLFCCVKCGEPLPTRQVPHLCLSCIRGRPLFHWCRGVCLYQGTAASALTRFKYDGQTSLLEPLGEVLVSGMGLLGPLPDVDLVVPVPLSWQGRWKRGFDQSHLLALKVARCLGVKVVAGVIRKRGIRRQVGLGARERVLNAASSFLPGKTLKQIRGQKVLLFDDVYTTGATIKACARILSGEAANVSVLTLARSERNRMVNSESRF